MEITVKIESESDILRARLILEMLDSIPSAHGNLVLGVVVPDKLGAELVEEYREILKAVDSFAWCGFGKTAVFRDIVNPE